MSDKSDDLRKRIVTRIKGDVLEPNDHTKHIDHMIELLLQEVELFKDLKVAILAKDSKRKYVSAFYLKSGPLIIEHDDKDNLERDFLLSQFAQKTWRTKSKKE